MVIITRILIVKIIGAVMAMIVLHRDLILGVIDGKRDFVTILVLDIMSCSFNFRSMSYSCGVRDEQGRTEFC